MHILSEHIHNYTKRAHTYTKRTHTYTKPLICAYRCGFRPVETIIIVQQKVRALLNYI
jgi:hypothetical protein